MFKFVLLLCLCLISIYTDGHKKADAQFPMKPDLGVLLGEGNYVYPFNVFKK